MTFIHQIPAGIAEGTLRLFNQFGLLVRTVTVRPTDDEGTALNVRGLQPGFYSAVVQLGKTTVRRATLAVQ
jgi:hypothetical protein